jgi:hypothetical protein
VILCPQEVDVEGDAHRATSDPRIAGALGLEPDAKWVGVSSHGENVSGQDRA